ncbi:hypothetical protein BGW38_005789 [Lunasporangiospora selenospora]|uniref:Uncharacterized protein n=1 Tax=Lunasporangiospora selenospora TaxID=979761 RepID=A0A9P6G048_9FUNG|nr:hypothetical protein BGW38_005789 [Lunasporangiospora selenospora]
MPDQGLDSNGKSDKKDADVGSIHNNLGVIVEDDDAMDEDMSSPNNKESADHAHNNDDDVDQQIDKIQNEFPGWVESSDSDEDGSEDNKETEASDDNDHDNDQDGSEDDSDSPTEEQTVDEYPGSKIRRPSITRRTSATPKKKRPSSSSSTTTSNASSASTSSKSGTASGKKIMKKSKKTVKPKGSKGSLSTAAARQATEEAKLEAAKPIVSQFLELENTKMNDKLLQVFMINGRERSSDRMIPFVVGSITRLDPEVAKTFNHDMDIDATQEAKFMSRVQQCSRKRDYSDINLMKKSYTAMNFFTRSDVYNEFILSNNHQIIVKELFKIFRPESDGNFYHFQKVFETILKKFRSQTMTTLFEDVDAETGESRTPLIFDMLPFLDQSPVALSMIKVLFPAFTYGFVDKFQEYYGILQNGHFLEMLLAMVTLIDDPSQSIGDFVVILLDEATRSKEAKIFLSCLADDPIWADRLAQGVQSASSSKRHSCIEIIYSILVRSIQNPFQDMFSNSIYITQRTYDGVESHLERVATEFAKSLSKHIPSLCQVFVKSQNGGGKISLPGYVVPTSFTVARLWLLDSIYHCLTDIKENPQLLESIPEQFWSMLVDSFVHFRFNNAYHVQFYKMFRMALYSEQQVIYQRFFVNTGLVNRLIDHYNEKSRPTGSRGYIILILNCVRLSVELEFRDAAEAKVEADTSESAEDKVKVSDISPQFWTDLLNSNADWEAFQAPLREATLEQTQDTLCDVDPNLRFQFAPLQARHPAEAPLTKRHIGIPGVTALGNDGIDLGSRYGNSLGFGVPMKYDRSQDTQKKEKEAQTMEQEIQKALANLMPIVDWKLIPPQRVLNAIANSKNKQGDTNKSNGSSSAGASQANGQSSESEADNSTTATTTDTTNAISDTGSSAATANGGSKPKKKKKNKKRKSEKEHQEPDEESRSNGHSDSAKSDQDSTCNEVAGQTTDCPESSRQETTHMDLDEEQRLERRREKNREKKRRNKLKKSQLSSQTSNAGVNPIE